MTRSDLEQARVLWLADEPSFREFGELMKGALEAEIKRLGIKADITMRTKDIDSLIKKLILKPEHTYETLGDKIGIRAVVRYQREVDEIVASMPALLGCSAPDDTRQRLAGEKDEKVGYISIHLDAWFKDDDPQQAKFPKGKYRAEVQVRTLAQHLWSEISHDTSYKSGTKIRKDLKRRIHLLAGLIEVADNEFSRIDDEMSKMPDMAEFMILKALERQYYKLSARPGNTDLSLEVIRLLWPLYELTPEQISNRFGQLLDEKRAVLQDVFDQMNKTSKGRSAFFFQPEILLIYDQLQFYPYKLRERWAERFPPQELEMVATAFGHSFA
jgi:ppGpp synthetase/RelA/SpoT-type nucleotidyltranferase